MTLTYTHTDIYDLVAPPPHLLDVHEQLSQIERGERATVRRATRAALTGARDTSFALEQAAECLDRAEHYAQLANQAVARQDFPAADYWGDETDKAMTQHHAWLDGDIEVAPTGAALTPSRFHLGGEFDRDFDDAGDLELPEPTVLTDMPSRRFVTIVSDARNWAYEDTGLWEATPLVKHYKNGRWQTLPGTPRQRRTYPGQHIIGALRNDGGDMLAREAIITVWNATQQCWMLVRATEGPKHRGFTQWLPAEFILVPPGRVVTWEWNAEDGVARPVFGETPPAVERASLDDHSARCLLNLDLALEWAWKWAQAVRAEHAEPEATDGAGRAWIRDAQ